jgi:hypothetical protein
MEQLRVVQRAQSKLRPQWDVEGLEGLEGDEVGGTAQENKDKDKKA